MSEDLIVVRGPDWKWGNQDGGEGSVGTVLKLLKSSAEIGSKQLSAKTAIVKWYGGSSNLYRVGAEDAHDLRILVNVHASIKHDGIKCDSCGKKDFKGFRWCCAQCEDNNLCSKCYMSDKHNLEHEFFRIDSPSASNVKVSKRRGCKKVTIKKSSDIDVDISSYYPDHLPLLALPKFEVDDTVKIDEDNEKVKSLQVGHGGWVDSMAKAAGKLGTVISVNPTGNIKVLVDGDVWVYNQECLTRVDKSELGKLALGAFISKVFDDSEASGGLIGLVKNLIQNLSDEDDKKKSTDDSSSSSSSVTKKLDINAQDSEGNTSLHTAVAEGNLETAEKLIKQGVEVSQVNAKGCSPLHLAVDSGSTACTRLLLKENCDVKLQDFKGNTALHCAISKGNDEIIDLLVSHSETNLRLQNNKGYNVLHHASWLGNKFAVEMILKKSPQMINDTDDDGNTALHVAIKSGSYEITRTLLGEEYCKIEIRNNAGETPLLLASKLGRCSEVEILVFLGADITAETGSGNTSLHLSLLNQYNEDSITFTNAHTMSMISSDIAKEPKVERSSGLVIACFLVQKGSNLYHKNHLGKTPLDFVLSPSVQDLLLKFSRKSSNIKSKSSSTSENQAHKSHQSFSMCIICDEKAELVLFKPCGHMTVCSPCSLRMKKCITCKSLISDKIKPHLGRTK